MMSPTLSVFGSFFPTWLLFALLGVIFAFVVRAICVRRHWDVALPMPVLFYLACAAAFTFGSYLVWLA
ncbi:MULTISPECIES: YtcA family lipoprotein [Luteibacter]|jgi:YtcA family|uniref:YtcA family lipoprotein n=1 Tax=Luteibacter sp. dw_328 TaxID=2719796 RepID=UPI0009ED484A|nr:MULTISPECIES: YtcA family lipoprotein [Luteibacter]